MLARLGYKVLRLEAQLLLTNLSLVLQHVHEALCESGQTSRQTHLQLSWSTPRPNVLPNVVGTPHPSANKQIHISSTAVKAMLCPLELGCRKKRDGLGTTTKSRHQGGGTASRFPRAVVQLSTSGVVV